MLKGKSKLNTHQFNVHVNFANGRAGGIHDVRVVETKLLNTSLNRFFDIESLGVVVVGSALLEIRIILSRKKYDAGNMIWTVKYPWIKNPADLPNNYYSVLARLKTTENILRKKGSKYAAEYDKQITDMVDRGAAEQISGADQYSISHIMKSLNHPLFQLLCALCLILQLVSRVVL